jgi:transcriptional regulator with GAF, ATPase, and Fis domain
MMETEPSSQTANRHLSILRNLMTKDVFRQPKLGQALTTVAATVKESLQAAEAMVALWHPSDQKWSAVTSTGIHLGHRGVSAHGSRTVLEQIKDQLAPVLTSSTISLSDLQIASHSIEEMQIGGVLAVPFFWWEFHAGTTSQRLGGCLYAHRLAGEEPFTREDVALLSDITSIAQPNFNLLHHLGQLELSLEASRAEARHLRKTAAELHRLGNLRSFDRSYSSTVLAPLQRASQVDRVGILLLGPTGSGKSHIARCYHYESTRKDGPFVVLDCSQVTSAETLTAELFGYAPFSGYANAPQKGRLGKAQLADKGTLFLDEIACLPLPLQQQLLRLIETGTFAPLGSSKESHVDIQIIAATHEDLTQAIQQRRFREDLYWRLSEVTVTLPTLCQHAADIPSIAEQCLQQACSHYRRYEIKSLSPQAMTQLQAFPWGQAGNIRGLNHTVSRSVLMAPPDTTTLEPEHLHFHQTLQAQTPFSSATSPQHAPSMASPQPAQPQASTPLASTPLPLSSPGPLSSQEDKVAFLTTKIKQYAGTLSEMTMDQDISHILGYKGAPIPYSSLRIKLQGLGLAQLVKEERERQRGTHLTLEQIKATIREHGSGSAAAEALGLTRAAMVWRLRKAGLTIGDILQPNESTEPTKAYGL